MYDTFKPSRYIKKLNPDYGFSQATFEIIGIKLKNMNTAERYGKAFFLTVLRPFLQCQVSV